MDEKELIPADVKRFILRSVDSIPHLEAALLLHHDPKVEWDAKMMAQRLYISEKKAADILSGLKASGFAAENAEQPLYRYNPVSLEFEKIMDQLALIYPQHLVEVTNLVHSKIDKQAQQLGDAFKWQKDKD